MQPKMEACKIRSTTQPPSHAQGLEGKEISSPSGRGRKMSLTSPLIDQDFAAAMCYLLDGNRWDSLE